MDTHDIEARVKLDQQSEETDDDCQGEDPEVKEPTIAEIALKRRLLTDEITEKETALKALKKERDVIDNRLMESMDETGVPGMSIPGVGSFSSKVQEFVQVDDWEKFHQYILAQQAPYLLQRRASGAAVMELIEDAVTVARAQLGEGEDLPDNFVAIPGTCIGHKKILSFRRS